MPTYDYRCPANDRVIEVSHSMATTLTSWQELAALAGLELGDTPGDAPVERVLSGGLGVMTSKGAMPDPPAGGSCCSGGGCGC